MPVACNQNGFQLAENLNEFRTNFGMGINPYSLALYGIFFFSSIGVILLFLLVFKKQFSIKWDWCLIIGVLVSSIYSVSGINYFGINDITILQSGAYVILLGILIALLFLIKASWENDKNKVNTKTEQIDYYFSNKKNILFFIICGTLLFIIGLIGLRILTAGVSTGIFNILISIVIVFILKQKYYYKFGLFFFISGILLILANPNYGIIAAYAIFLYFLGSIVLVLIGLIKAIIFILKKYVVKSSS
jgi:hypothetical protein